MRRFLLTAFVFSIVIAPALLYGNVFHESQNQSHGSHSSCLEHCLAIAEAVDAVPVAVHDQVDSFVSIHVDVDRIVFDDQVHVAEVTLPFKDSGEILKTRKLE